MRTHARTRVSKYVINYVCILFWTNLFHLTSIRLKPAFVSTSVMAQWNDSGLKSTPGPSMPFAGPANVRTYTHSVTM